MITKGGWDYYTLAEAVELLVTKLEDDEFDLNLDGDWTAFGGDALDQHWMYYKNEKNIRHIGRRIRRRTAVPPESIHFL